MKVMTLETTDESLKTIYEEICASLTDIEKALPTSPDCFHNLQATLLRVGDYFTLAAKKVKYLAKEDDTFLFVKAIDNLSSQLKRIQEKLTPASIEPNQLNAYHKMCEAMQEYLDIQNRRLKNRIAFLNNREKAHAYSKKEQLYHYTISLDNYLFNQNKVIAVMFGCTLMFALPAVISILYAPPFVAFFACLAAVSLLGVTILAAIERSTEKRKYQKAKLETEQRLTRLGMTDTLTEKRTEITSCGLNQCAEESHRLEKEIDSFNISGNALLESIKTTTPTSGVLTFFVEIKPVFAATPDTTNIHHEDDKLHENSPPSSPAP